MKTIFPEIDTESPAKPDETYIKGMFDRLARRYDLFTALISFGQAARWRNEALRPLKKGMRLLDLGCGTGDMALAAVRKIGADGEIVGLDFSEQMLAIAKSKYQRLNIKGNFQLALKKAEDLPLDGLRFDLVVSGFVLRNLYENIDRILSGVLASLKNGGEIRFLDLTEPAHPVLAALFRFQLLTYVGLCGALLFGKDYPIPYLPDSARRFVRAREFCDKLNKAGFQNVRARSFLFGAVTLYQAEKRKIK